MQNKSYIYTYDDYGRRTAAKASGCGPSLTRYDDAGRVTAEHTPASPAYTPEKYFPAEKSGRFGCFKKKY